MTDELKAGDRVKLTVEGVVREGYEEISLLWLDTDDDEDFYIEGHESSFATIEVVKPPFTDGLYYETLGDGYDQISLVYKHESGKWYDFQLDEIDPSPETLSTLVRLGPVS